MRLTPSQAGELLCLLSCSYSLHNKGFEFFHAKDQTQTVVVSLLNLTASGIMCSETLLEQCTKHTAMAICKLYKDPFQIWVSFLQQGWPSACIAFTDLDKTAAG